MKKARIALLALSCALGFTRRAMAENEPITVTFASVQALEDKRGNKLDGSVKFYFADEKQPAKGGELITSRANGNGLGRDKEGKCRMALLQAFLKFQARAQREGKTMVVDVKTAPSAKDPKSGKRSQCGCAAGAVRVGAYVEGRLAGGK